MSPDSQKGPGRAENGPFRMIQVPHFKEPIELGGVLV